MSRFVDYFEVFLFQIPKGTYIQIGALSTHYCAEFWQSPEIFNPSRFSPEARKNHHKYQFLPFGLGPRVCVGMRLAMVETKLALANLIKNFRFTMLFKILHLTTFVPPSD